MQKLTVLGATGSIGISTLAVVEANPEQFSIYALTGHSQVKKLVEQAVKFRPEVIVVGSADLAKEARTLVEQHQLNVEIEFGEQALERVASAEGVDTVVAAIVGAAGMRSCLAAARASKRILLANKEALVMSGQLFIDEVKKYNACLLPVDSEHNAIFQSLPLDYQQGYLDKSIEDYGVTSIILTGSGGPFRETALEDLPFKTPKQACAHPNWSMGQKISVDSASMMNKGLEFIEACYLFGVSPDFIEVLIHPQSVIHSMVRYQDGSVLAQMGQPDMKTPIAHTMAWPKRITSTVEPFDFVKCSGFTFQAPCQERYPNLYLAKEAFRQGQEVTTVLNAANEEHVDRFLKGQIAFTDIAKYNARILEKLSPQKACNLTDILEIDKQARSLAHELLN
ncbi:1-deoxy-D-xylulose-5-phosphate reductoisomerase [Catenovulum sp. SM1970]|uniref:1-deoxy-D-xylulose-5-phosphate reductoisomerase n=1 Tax=Marinifaba aquimaris TaxID=2741323 RepID=UPI00157396AB|nr:1-deoxy-D-xylulose-5-phosphate reductoisomerase [Marinifaba aquimaris]NTS77087.1 1-deoxy-D-xylulose-5-phosphate reductoisomerase [Marinifaba aquimaris]